MPITPIQLGVRSNPGSTAAISAARLINCRAEDAGQEGKIQYPIVACDGFNSWSSTFGAISGSGTIRGGFVLSDTAMYVASGTRIIKLNTSGTPTAISGKSATFTVTLASPGVFTSVAHGLESGATITLSTTGALPTGLAAATTYYLIDTGLTADAFRLSATPGGTVINTSGSQSGTHTWTTGTGLISASGMVTMARNRKEPNAQIGIVTPGHLYILENDTLVDYTGLITSLGSAGTLGSIAALDGYFILYFDNGEFFASSIDEGGEIDTLDFAKSESNPDGGVKVLTRGRDVVLAGERSTEFWQNTGATDFPFERVTSADYGCYAAASMVNVTLAKPDGEVTDSVCMAATDSKGAYVGVVLLSGYSGVKISHGGVDRAVRDETDKTTIRGFSRTESGRTFYTLRGSTFTWVYDFSTGFWHERTSSGLAFWRVWDAFIFNGMVILADYTLAALYKSIAGIAGASDSTVVLKHSNDSGNTWVTRTAKTLSGASNLKQRMKWNRLGQSKTPGKVFQLTISNAVIENSTANSMTVQPPTVHAHPARLRFYQFYADTIPGGSQTSTPKGILGLAVNTVTLTG